MLQDALGTFLASQTPEYSPPHTPSLPKLRDIFQVVSYPNDLKLTATAEQKCSSIPPFNHFASVIPPGEPILWHKLTVCLQPKPHDPSQMDLRAWEWTQDKFTARNPFLRVFFLTTVWLKIFVDTALQKMGRTRAQRLSLAINQFQPDDFQRSYFNSSWIKAYQPLTEDYLAPSSLHRFPSFFIQDSGEPML